MLVPVFVSAPWASGSCRWSRFRHPPPLSRHRRRRRRRPYHHLHHHLHRRRHNRYGRGVVNRLQVAAFTGVDDHIDTVRYNCKQTMANNRHCRPFCIGRPTLYPADPTAVLVDRRWQRCDKRQNQHSPQYDTKGKLTMKNKSNSELLGFWSKEMATTMVEYGPCLLRSIKHLLFKTL